MKYYFVAQGQTYLTEHSQKYLWAPIDNIWHHKIMNDVKKGDVILFAIDPEGNDAWDGGRLVVNIKSVD